MAFSLVVLTLGLSQYHGQKTAEWVSVCDMAMRHIRQQLAARWSSGVTTYRRLGGTNNVSLIFVAFPSPERRSRW